MRGAVAAGWLAALALTGSGCASPLPDYAKPRGTIADRGSVDEANLIPYRTLVREDFQASEPPPEIAPYRESIGAATCGLIRPTRDSRIAAQPRGDHFEAWIPSLRFEARMDRNCSWWNDDFHSHTPEYALQHEQIHFAIHELGARRLNAEAEQIAIGLRSRGETPELAVAELEAKFRLVIEEALQRSLERSQAFDEDTSMSHNAIKQSEWARRIEDELARSAP